MTISIDYNYSRYTPLDVTNSEYNIFKSAYKNIRFALPIAQKYTITHADQANLPGLSDELFGDTSLWRILLAFNGLADPIQDVYPGLVINVPTKASVIDYLSRQQTNTSPTFTI